MRSSSKAGTRQSGKVIDATAGIQVRKRVKARDGVTAREGAKENA
jgi:hypothetical protein